MGAFNNFAKDIRHVGHLGLGYLARHPMAWLGRKSAVVNIKDVGPFQIRDGDSDAAVLRQVFIKREYDLSRYRQHNARLDARYAEILSAGQKPLIIDAGANIGAASIWYARAYPEALVLAVEPEPENLVLCRANTQARANIKVVAGAIGAQSGCVEIFNDSKKGQSDAFQTRRAEEGVKVFSVADLKAQAGADATLFIVKVDIEGFESDLFSAETNWIDECAALIVEPHDWLFPGKHSSRSLQQAMLSRDFELLLRPESLAFVR